MLHQRPAPRRTEAAPPRTQWSDGVGRQAGLQEPPPQGELSPTAPPLELACSNGQTKPDNAILLLWNHRFRPLSEKVRQLACGATAVPVYNRRRAQPTTRVSSSEWLHCFFKIRRKCELNRLPPLLPISADPNTYGTLKLAIRFCASPCVDFFPPSPCVDFYADQQSSCADCTVHVLDVVHVRVLCLHAAALLQESSDGSNEALHMKSWRASSFSACSLR